MKNKHVKLISLGNGIDRRHIFRGVFEGDVKLLISKFHEGKD